MIQNDRDAHSPAVKNSEIATAEFHNYFVHAPVAIATMHAQRFTVANHRFAELIGKSTDQIIGRSLDDVMPEVAAAILPSLNEALTTGIRAYASEVPLPDRSKDKTLGYFNLVFDPTKDTQGNTTGIFISAIDVTEQVVAKLRLQENDWQLRLFADAMPVLISYVDRNERYQLTNKHYEEWFGESAEHVKGMSMLEMLGEKAYAAIHPYVARALAGERVSYESKVNYKKKGETYIHATYIPNIASSNEVLGFYVLVEDITERRITDDKIKQSESQFRRMTDTVPAIIWLTNKTGYCTYLNKHWYDATGQTQEEALGFGWLTATHPEDSPGAEATFLEANADQKDFSATYRLKHADGQYRWVIDRGSPRFDNAGNFEGMTGSVVEIHQQKEAEGKIRESELQYRLLAEQLEQLVEARTRELQRSNEDLQQFAHVASHDLKEPVRKVKTFVDRLIYDYSSEIPEKALEYLKKIDKSCDRMNTMVEGVLKYSTLTSLEDNIEKVDIAELIRNIESDLEVVIEKKKASIEKINLPTIQGSNILLYQLFYNLINNSLKFSIANRAPVISISAHAANEQEILSAGLISSKQYYTIRITDNGIGFSAQHADKIFKVFMRLNSKDQFEGTGLGLSLCKTIVERHQGAIWATGENLKGATFTILLPA
ncbi:PAS domain S-box protein [Pseudochryseolinea flava]|uniref:histidine kinase n=1 Tax=Pseudochryseolinea flava TaxID=2059302 RepID=A0A364Y526_9BACT|nr:PAS domain S-box protein [Pseudochryseolinea flava]RAW02096.1 hypothetical protein DQQ10_05965 [Pseudochryseolinea flava]